ncbi:hydantoinase/carbamoylase family amidase [Pontibacillus yanchengensis]|uniref:Hydantoinase/carbamoylase family amidase n=1 Tax=Pontibacillus yanchengensis TaxID=462910 RepID=A0ACC7VHV3_9BACI|nr:M20 family metallo-hydrolase [Pontibacillus yanchengensis]MYL54347.1 hydantoinase/carbamoylase family amidase [Pontibacillus yanchengensis]
MNDLTNWLENHLLQLNLVNEMDYENGFSRLSYTPEEEQAHEAFRTIAKNLGLHIYADGAGNQWATWKVDEHAPTVAVGSHLDTVHGGGGYDGVAGVLTGLGAIKLLQDLQVEPKKNIAVICFASEESARYGVSTIGSKAISGILDKHDLEHVTDADGVTIRESIEAFGLSWETIDQAEKSPDDLESFLELHIEQGTQIEDNDAEIGIVRGVACPIRLQVNVKGMANHTGTTPMNKRSDAFVAIAPLIPFVEEQANSMNKKQELPIVATVSTVHLQPNAMNVIPGEVQLGIDIRSVNDLSKRELTNRIEAYCQQIERERNVTISIETLVDNDSVFLDQTIQSKLSHVTNDLQLNSIIMDSGAGHDVMNMAQRWRSGLLFIPCREGISHHPKEYASIEDLHKGTHVIAEYLRIETGDDHENEDWRNRA